MSVKCGDVLQVRILAPQESRAIGGSRSGKQVPSIGGSKGRWKILCDRGFCYRWPITRSLESPRWRDTGGKNSGF